MCIDVFITSSKEQRKRKINQKIKFKIKEKNDRDQGLFSELTEPPIHPYLVRVVPPFLAESNPVYIIQMGGEAAWKWRVFYRLPRRVFDSLLPLG